MGFVIASGLRYQPRHVVVAQDATRGLFAKRPGCIPPQMSPALTALPACRGRRCFMSTLAPGLPGAPLFLAPRIGTANPCRHASHLGARRCNMAQTSHWDTAMKRFADLSEQEILALAITNEEEDSRIYQGFAD